MLDQNFVEDEVTTVDTKQVTAYTIRRSVSSPYLFTVIAVNHEGEGLFVVESDITFESAQKITETHNSKPVN
jgi:hypothetical protein